MEFPPHRPYELRTPNAIKLTVARMPVYYLQDRYTSQEEER